MSLAQAALDCPELASPAHLAMADTAGKWRMAPHHEMIAAKLMEAADDPRGARKILNVAYGHGKSVLAAHYFPAWYLLNFPDKRIILVAHSEPFASDYGKIVRDIIGRWGKRHGVELRSDSKAKLSWEVKGHGGGMVCAGPGSGVIGKHCDLFLIDDLIHDPQDAYSDAVLDGHWEFYKSVVFTRISRVGVGCVLIGTRWCRKDLFGRVLDMARRTGEPWEVIKFKALAEENDPLGRKLGEALWPEMVPLKQLLIAKQEFGSRFRAGWQQEPEEDGEGIFQPRSWPRYEDCGELWRLPAQGGGNWKLVLKRDCTVFFTVDWAWSKKPTADRSAILFWSLTPDGRLLLLDTVCERYRLNELAPAISSGCATHHPVTGAVEVGHPTLSEECRKYPAIPEIRWVSPQGANKRQRSLPAQAMADNGNILLPKCDQPWYDTYCRRLSLFTGAGHDGDEDDEADATSTAAELARTLRASMGVRYDENLPTAGGPLGKGRELYGREVPTAPASDPRGGMAGFF